MKTCLYVLQKSAEYHTISINMMVDLSILEQDMKDIDKGGTVNVRYFAV